MSIPDRELTITYGSYSIGGTTGIQPIAEFRYGKGPLAAWVEFDFMIVGAGVNDAAATADLLSKCAAADAAFRIPRAALTVVMNGTHISFSPGSNTGFDSMPEISTPDGEDQTGLTRLYRVRVNVELPADTYSQSGRADSRVDLGTALNARRSLEISGEYRALGGSDARSQYQSAIAAYESSLESGFGGTWVKLDEHAVANDTIKKLTFQRAYREVYSSYLLEAAIALDYPEPNRRRVLTITGTYLSSAPGSVSSRAVYLAQIAAFQNAITTAFGGTWYLAPESAKTEDNDARCDFRRTLYEVYSGYLLRSRIDLSWAPSRLRRLVVAGVYVAGGSLGAYANYLAGGSVYATAIYNTLGGTWKLVGEQPVKDDNDQQCEFALVYEEQNTGGTMGPLAHAAVTQQDLGVRIASPAPGDSPGGAGGTAVRLREASATFFARIDRTLITDLKGFYESTIRPYILGEIATASGGTVPTVLNDAPDIQADSSTIAATIDAVIAGGNVLEYEQATQRDVDPGIEIEGVWTSNDHDAYVWPAFAIDVITIRMKRRSIAGTAPLDPTSFTPSVGGFAWIPLPYTSSSIPRKLGLPGMGQQLDVVDETLEARWRGVNVVKGGSGISSVTGNTSAASSGASFSEPGGNNSSPSPSRPV